MFTKKFKAIVRYFKFCSIMEGNQTAQNGCILLDLPRLTFRVSRQLNTLTTGTQSGIQNEPRFTHEAATPNGIGVEYGTEQENIERFEKFRGFASIYICKVLCVSASN